MYTLNDVRVVHLEPTQLCQALCPMCDRTTLDGMVNPKLTNASLSLQQVQSLFTPKLISQLDKMYMCGNVGDPMLTPDCIDIFKYFRKHNSSITLSIVTNGGARTISWWKELATVVNHCTFSIDGLQDTNHIYRKGVQWKNVIRNVKAFIEAGGTANWAFLVFEHNEHQVEQARSLSQELGFKQFIVKSTSRYNNKSSPTKTTFNRKGEEDFILRSPSDSMYVNEVLKQRISYERLERSTIVPKCVSKKEIFISATGDVYPCCWSHTPIITMQDEAFGDEKLDAIGQQGPFKINAFELGLEKAMDWFSSFEERWNTDDKPMICVKKCNSIQDPFTLQTLRTYSNV